MNGISDLRMFLEIARSPTMTAAAGALGMSTATISGRLKALEDHFGLSLVERTTRRLSLTEDGRVLMCRAQSVVDGYNDIKREMGRRKQVASGDLIVEIPSDLGRWVLTPLIEAFSARFPDIGFQFRTDPSCQARAEPFDVALKIGCLPNSNFITRKIGELRQVTCASPDYLRRKGRPKTPSCLEKHDLLVHSGGARQPSEWTFSGPELAVIASMSARRKSSDLQVLKSMAIDGHGILKTHFSNVAEEVAQARLEVILSGFEAAPLPLHLLTAARNRLPFRTMQFVDFTVRHFRDAAWRPGIDNRLPNAC